MGALVFICLSLLMFSKTESGISSQKGHIPLCSDKLSDCSFYNENAARELSAIRAWDSDP